MTNYALTFASFTIVLDCVSMKHEKLDVWRRLTKFLIHTRGSTYSTGHWTGKTDKPETRS